MDITVLISRIVESNASDLHITVGYPPTMRLNGKLITMTEGFLTPEDTKSLVKEVINDHQFEELDERGELDCSYSSPGLGRFRVNIFKQRGSYGLALRQVPLNTPSMETLGIPPVVKELANKPRGLILVTGPTGSGKSTTLASMIDLINREKSYHILTLEDPIEYIHKHNKSIVNQREIGNDSNSFSNALRSALRQDPDVILVGEMRDLETISIAITAAETGHLVLSTLHTLGAAKTIDRIIDVFPPHQQQQIRVQLASVIQGVISQQLLPQKDGRGRVAAFEVMVANPAVKNLIREGKTHQIQNSIQTGSKYGMQLMDSCLINLFKKDLIDQETLLSQGVDVEFINRMILL
ncbi:type IV pilus twitching motility protein PilT [Alkaliphilus serpentinus]|uniref:Type IV pilus twitching motility protein PilT n=1 Tax=Alkaliphilus serpentinus TaxID=1482731 RepID=A0A833M9E2_9FIRM|nr:type IV pilus twitching motility protein PilT [Alkaliphilus serpentinus]KAB3527594.1 type IV pilus twitching motility protein PilT [Alkaliphilus serpentinus]